MLIRRDATTTKRFLIVIIVFCSKYQLEYCFHKTLPAICFVSYLCKVAERSVKACSNPIQVCAKRFHKKYLEEMNEESLSRNVFVDRRAAQLGTGKELGQLRL